MSKDNVIPFPLVEHSDIDKQLFQLTQQEKELEEQWRLIQQLIYQEENKDGSE